MMYENRHPPGSSLKAWPPVKRAGTSFRMDRRGAGLRRADNRSFHSLRRSLLSLIHLRCIVYPGPEDAARLNVEV